MKKYRIKYGFIATFVVEAKNEKKAEEQAHIRIYEDGLTAPEIDIKEIK